MLSATFSEFRNKAKDYFDAVESGETVEILRYGKPIAIISPVKAKDLSTWKKASPINLAGISLSRALLSARKE